MTPEDVARLFARRPGYKLVSYAEVVLPVYRLTLEVITLDHKKIPPIEEFILKSLDAGLQTINEISSLLGIKESVIRGGLINLLRSEDISLISISNERRFKLTSKGEQTLFDAITITPQEHTIQVYFDGLLQKPVPYYKEKFHSSRQINDLSYYEIPAWPPTKPQLSDLSRQEVGKVIKQVGRLKDYKSELIAVKKIEKAFRVGRYAIALVYRSKQSNEINVAFVVDGIQSKELESAFARQNGPRRIHLEQYFNDGRLIELLKTIPKEMLGQIPPEEELEQLEESEANTQLRIKTTESEIERAINPKAKQEARVHLLEVTQELERIHSNLDQFPIRHLNVYEHSRILKKAIFECKERLMIIASRITSPALDTELISLLEAALQRDVSVYIAYTVGKRGIGQRSSELRQAEERLKSLTSHYANFKLKNLGKEVEPLLLYDRRCVVLGNFSWFAYKGNPDKIFQADQGVMVTKSEYIDEKFKEKLDYFIDD